MKDFSASIFKDIKPKGVSHGFNSQPWLTPKRLNNRKEILHGVTKGDSIRCQLKLTNLCWWLIVLAALCCPVTAEAMSQPRLISIDPKIDDSISVSAHVERTEIQIADPLELTIVATIFQPTTSENKSLGSVEFPAVPDRLGEWEVVSHIDRWAVPQAEGKMVWQRRYQLETLKTGEIEIPAITVMIDDVPFQTDSIPIRVMSSLEEEDEWTQYRGFKDAVQWQVEKSWWNKLGWWGRGGAMVLALLAIVGLVLAFRRKVQTKPDQWANQQLTRIQESLDNQQLSPNDCLPAVADLLREYIRRQFEIPATRQTTPEFLDAATKDKRLTEGQQQSLRQFLQEVDRVKFASFIPPMQRTEIAIEQARQFVTESAEGLVKQ